MLNFDRRKMRSLRLQFLSDIHLEKRSYIPKIKKCSEHIAILGDIGDPWNPHYLKFLEDLSRGWSRIFLLSGNHEYYFGKTVPRTEAKLKELCASFENITFMQRNSFDLEDYTVLGLTMFPRYTNSNGIHKELSLYHDMDEEWLQANIRKPGKKIVLSHYLPSRDLIVEPYRTRYSIEDQKRWALSKEHHFDPELNYWLCGHSHCRIRKNIKGVECRINTTLIPDAVDLH